MILETPDSSAAGGPAKTRRPTAWMMVCAGVTLALYLLVPHIAIQSSSAKPSYSFEVFPWVGKVTAESIAALHTTLSYGHVNREFFLLCAGLFAIYGVMLRLARGWHGLSTQAFIFAAGAVYLVFMLFVPVMLSTDVFAYAFYGRLLSIHGTNAYVANPEVTSDAFYALFNQQCLVSMYGPFWTLISAGLTKIAGNHVGLTVLLFRGFSVASTLGTAALIWKGLRIHSPSHAAQGLVLFLWNPLVILESGLSGHNDATMVVLAMFGVWMHLKGMKTGAVVLLTLSALVKFITGMLIPLYMLMVMRGMLTWKHRITFFIRGSVAAGMVAALISFLAKAESNVPASNQATAPDFYSNNFHELIFKGVRRLLGEDAESVEVPINYGSWWVTTTEKTMLGDKPAADAKAIASLEKDQKLIVITPTLSEWMRVYDPKSRQKGYLSTAVADQILNPGEFGRDPVLEQLELNTSEWPTVLKANRIVRVVTWALFAAFGLLAAWKTTDFDRFLLWSGAALLASYFLVMTQIWPWYLMWALAFAAMKPGCAPARLAVLLSGFVLTLYMSIAYASGADEWIYTYRSLPAIVLPFVIFLGTLFVWRPGKPAAG